MDLQFLEPYIENCKTVNIVTNDMERFKKVQDNLYEKEDILISVSNNKNKALKKAKYIFNVNMNKSEMKKYKIDRNAIIINLKENVKIDDTSFEGININYFQISIPDDYIEKYLAEKDLNLTATLDAKSAYKDAEFVVIAAPTNYDSKKNFFDTSAVEAVIKLVIEYNPDAIMVI